MSLLLGLSLSTKKKQSESSSCQSAKIARSRLNNPAVICNTFNKGLCTLKEDMKSGIGTESMVMGTTKWINTRKNYGLIQEV